MISPFWRLFSGFVPFAVSYAHDKCFGLSWYSHGFQCRFYIYIKFVLVEEKVLNFSNFSLKFPFFKFFCVITLFCFSE